MLFVTVKTSLGIGQVVAVIICQYESDEMITEGLTVLKQWNPTWYPQFFMTDKNAAELAAIGHIFPNSIRLVCDFHRAQAMERWVAKASNGIRSEDRATVSDALKSLAYAKTEMEFHQKLEQLQRSSYYKFQAYLRIEWLSCTPVCY